LETAGPERKGEHPAKKVSLKIAESSLIQINPAAQHKGRRASPKRFTRHTQEWINDAD